MAQQVFNLGHLINKDIEGLMHLATRGITKEEMREIMAEIYHAIQTSYQLPTTATSIRIKGIELSHLKRIVNLHHVKLKLNPTSGGMQI